MGPWLWAAFFVTGGFAWSWFAGRRPEGGREMEEEEEEVEADGRGGVVAVKVAERG